MAKLPTSTDVPFAVSDTLPSKADAVVLCVAEGQAATDADVPGECAAALKRLVDGGAFKGKPREVAVDLVPAADGRHRRLLLVGIGKATKVTAETLREAGGAAVRAARRTGGGALAVLPPTVESLSPDAVADALVTGCALAAFDFREYQGAVKNAGDKPKDLAVTLVGPKSMKPAVDRAAVMAEGQNFARTIANRPGNDLNPPSLAKVAEELAKVVGLTCRVMDEKDLKKRGMGGILAVGAGSASPPRLIALEYDPGVAKPSPKSKSKKPKPPQSPLLVVGKAITFDTGGISIKSAANMGRMIFDKSGGMAVLGLMYAVAKLGLKVPVVGLLSSAENMPGHTAYRPGDILTMYNGVTVEVTNTDAEGRLVLADALAWGIETYKPRACVNLATLTGACVVALGETTAGAWCNDDALFAALDAASKAAGEKLWRMPLGEEFREKLKADAADIVNSAGRWGGACTAAEFLRFFVTGGKTPEAGEADPTPWCHLDIAGPADTETERPYYAKGGTAFGVRTLVEWAAGQA